jgi:mitochondrial ribonuclease P protein 3
MTYIAWIDYSLRNRETCLANIHKMLNFVEANKIMLSEKTVRKLEEVLQQFDYKTSTSTITPKYQCSNCQRTLNQLEVTNEEFYKVRDSFMDKVLIRKDVFLKSSPTEIERFLAFLDKNVQPYDIIIDGLNVAYSAGTHKPPNVYANLVNLLVLIRNCRYVTGFLFFQLSSVVEYFVKKDQNVLVLGRKHMNGWPKQQMTYIRQNATFFLTENL